MRSEQHASSHPSSLANRAMVTKRSGSVIPTPVKAQKGLFKTRLEPDDDRGATVTGE
jgi:hypothetical protein